MPHKIQVYCKTDLYMAYGVSRQLFDKWIEPIKSEIKWIDGKQQKFPPKAVARIFEFLGRPD